MKTINSLAIIFSLLILFACSNKPSGSDYLGTWKDDKWEMVIKITKQGESYLIEGEEGMEGIYIITKENNLSGYNGMITAYFDKESKKLVFSAFSDAGITRWTKISSN